MVFLKNLILFPVCIILFINCGTENTPTFEMSISVDPPEAGSVISTPNQTVADQGTSIILRAEANEGWLFSSWSGDESSTVNPLTFTLDSDKSIIANFEAKSYPLTVIIDGEGTVIEEIIAQPKNTDYEHGTLVRLTAKPADGWRFQEWIEYPDSSNTIDLHITEATSVSVTFKLNLFKRADNGVTITCSKAEVGDKEILDGVEYTKRAVEEINVENASTTCTSGINDMTELFTNSNINDDISHWDVSSVTNMKRLFAGTPFDQDISYWDVSSVTYMGEMFTSSGFNKDIGNWDVSSVTYMGEMFTLSRFNQDIGNWDVSNVENMIGMFIDADEFNQDIGNWNVSSVTDMALMFTSANQFNQDISSWDVSSVTDMNSMFQGADNFNQDLSGWCVLNISSEPSNFAKNSALSSQNKPKWGTCPGG